MSLELEEQFYETERARLQRWLPWVHLFQAFRLATRWQNLALAMAAVLLLATGRWALSYTPFSAYSRIGAVTSRTDSVVPRTLWPWEDRFLTHPLPTVQDVSFRAAVESPLRTLGSAVGLGPAVLSPLFDFIDPARMLFQRRTSWSDVADAWLHMLLVVSLGTLIGGAITRRVAVEFAGRGEPGLGETVRFSVREFPFTFGAPVIPLVGIGLLFLMGRVVAWLGRTPGIDETVTAALWGLLLLFSLVTALIVLGVGAAWPLMVAAHSAEGTDGFDAMNRAYNYVFVRPWYALWLVLLTMAYGGVLIVFLSGLTGVVLQLTEWIAAGPISDVGLARITAQAPEWVTLTPPSEDPSPGVTGSLGAFWYRGLGTLLTAFVYSFFWTAATLIYFLLRKSVDAYDLDRVYLPKEAPKSDEPPLSGMPAVARREAESAAEKSAAPETPPPAEPSAG